MEQTFDGISFSLNSTMDLERRGAARSLIEVLLRQPVSIRPVRYGPFECDRAISNPSALVDCLVNQSGPVDGCRAGSLVLEKNKDCGIQVRWEKSDNPSLAFIAGHVGTTGSQAGRVIADLVAMFRELATAFDAVYGEVRSMRQPKWNTPMNLKLRLPDIPAIAVYGKPYIDLFGIDKIESAPVVRLEAIGKSHYLLQSVSSIDEPVPASVRQSIREHLGEQAFMADGRWRYQDGLAPTFNLTSLLSSPNHLQ